MNSILEYLKNDSEIRKYHFFQDDKFFGNKLIAINYFNFYLCFTDDRGYYDCFICSHKNLDEAYALDEICTIKELSRISHDGSMLKFIQKNLGLIKENIDIINKFFENIERNKTAISKKNKNTISIKEIMLSITKLYMERKATFQFFEQDKDKGMVQ